MGSLLLALVIVGAGIALVATLVLASDVDINDVVWDENDPFPRPKRGELGCKPEGES